MAINTTFIDGIHEERLKLMRSASAHNRIVAWGSLLIFVVNVAIASCWFLGKVDMQDKQNSWMVLCAFPGFLLAITILAELALFSFGAILSRKHDALLRLEVSMRHQNGLTDDFNTYFPMLGNVVDKTAAASPNQPNAHSIQQMHADYKLAEAIIEKISDDPAKCLRC